MQTSQAIPTQHRDFAKQAVHFRAGKLRWHVHPLADLAALKPVLKRPDDFLKEPKWLLKDTELVTLGHTAPYFPGEQRQWILRRLNYGTLLHSVRDAVRPASRALRAFRFGLALEQAGIPTPRVLAAVEQRAFGWPVKGFLLTEELSPATNVFDYLREHRRLPRVVLERLAEMIAHLHDQGLSHRDMKGTNILLDEQLRPWLIDLDGMRRILKTRVRRISFDLSRLASDAVPYPGVLRFGGMRFLKLYCRQRHWAGRERMLAVRIGNWMRC